MARYLSQVSMSPPVCTTEHLFGKTLKKVQLAGFHSYHSGIVTRSIISLSVHWFSQFEASAIFPRTR